MGFGIIALAVFITDFFVKNYMEKNRTEGVRKSCCGDKIAVQKLHNYGMAGGKLEKEPKKVLWITSVATALCGGYFLAILPRSEGRAERIGVSLIFGGALSNLADRIRRGYVVDYINFPKAFGKVKKLVFNISDFCIFAGCILTLFRKRSY